MPAIKRGDVTIKAAFGAENRNRLIDAYFKERGSETVSPDHAWEHVYRLLLWADQTTGLAHCYESDKSQPGKNWYARSLAFHDWVSGALGATPATLADDIDWLFRKATEDLANQILRNTHRIAESAERQRAPYEGRDFPVPGEDPELISIIREVLGTHLATEPESQQWQTLVQRIRQYLTLENKRKNLVGEGFEDVLGAVIRRAHITAIDVGVRRLLHDIRGFNKQRRGAKPNKVDVSLLRGDPYTRVLVTAKWSVRADREKQFQADFQDYVDAEADRRPFQYVFVTNEFDPARLMRACEMLIGNKYMFDHIVHISTDALRAAYGKTPERSMLKVIDYMSEGRLVGLGTWLHTFA